MQANIITSIGTFFNVDRFKINQGQQFIIELEEVPNVEINVTMGSWTTNFDRVLSLEETNEAESAHITANNTGTSIIRILSADGVTVLKKIEVEVVSAEAVKLFASVTKEVKEN